MAAANQRLGEYVLIDRIGIGAFGEVWRARHHAWADQIVAIKIPADARFAEYLRKEGAAVGRLVHPSIVRAIAFDPYSDPAYLAMEFVQGGNLRQRIGQGPMPVADAVAVMRQILAAIQYAHGRGIVHRDVKPENVLIANGIAAQGNSTIGAVKLSDFGLCTDELSTPNSIAFSTDKKMGPAIVGSMAYMSPEQREGREIDARSDLYSCGVVLFEMLTGKLPAGAELPSQRNSRVPQGIDEVFAQAYAPLDRRFKSAEEFLKALDAPIRPREHLAGRKSRFESTIVWTTAAIVAVLLFVIWILPLFGGGSPAPVAIAPMPPALSPTPLADVNASARSAYPSPFAGAPKELINAMTGKFASFDNGIYVLREGDRISTKDRFTPPVTFRIVAKTDSTNIRIDYAADQIIFNWEKKLDQLRVDGGPANGRHMDGAGRVPVNEGVTFDLVVQKTYMSIAVNGEPRYRTDADFSKINQPLAFSQGSQAVIQVKSVQVRAPRDATALAAPSVAIDRDSLKFGLYLHFDISTFGGIAQQDMGKVPASRFAPSGIDANQWVTVAKQCGMTYAVLTVKTDTGFCLWDSKASDYNITASPVKADVVAEFITACKAQGIIPGVHYSMVDAHDEGQLNYTAAPSPVYFNLIKQQITELHTQYPDIRVQVLSSDSRLTAQQSSELYQLISRLNPQCVVLGGSNAAFLNFKPDTVNGGWSWSQNAKLTPASELYTTYSACQTKNLPYLLNAGIDPTGRIPAQYVAVLGDLKRLIDAGKDAAGTAAPAPAVQFVSAIWGAGAKTADVSGIIAERYRANPVVSVTALPDPASGVHKTLTAHFKIGEQAIILTAIEGQTFSIAASDSVSPADSILINDHVKLVSATYGVDRRVADVRDKVAARLKTGQSAPSSQDLLGVNDPASGVAKSLTVRFDIDGRLFDLNVTELGEISLGR